MCGVRVFAQKLDDLKAQGQLQNLEGYVREQSKEQSGPAERHREIESIKRTLYNAIDRLEKIQRREGELTTT